MNIRVIILGAGLSTRYHKADNKLLEIIDNKPMFRHITDIILKLKNDFNNIESIVFVTSSHNISRDLHNDKKDINVIYNKHPQLGITSSMKIGIAYSLRLAQGYMYEGEIKDLNFTDQSNNFYLFTVADAPYIKYDTIVKFLTKFIKSNQRIGCFANNDILYNPVIFGEEYLEELLRLEGDKGGKIVVNNHLDKVFKFEVDSKEIEDIDS